MKKTLLSSVMTIGLLTLLLSATNANAAGWRYHSIMCPKTAFGLLPVGQKYDIEDIIVSADAPTSVTIRFDPPGIKFLTVYLDANETVVVNLTGTIESPEEMGVRLACDGVAMISVTLTGRETF